MTCGQIVLVSFAIAVLGTVILTPICVITNGG